MKTLHLKIFGVVQGVGFRPYVSVLAAECGVTGSVANKGSYVEVFAQGARAAEFAERVPKEIPPRAVVLRTLVRTVEREPYPDFAIIESEHEVGDIFVSPDIGVCEDCKRELFDPADRRYLHPFINCTQCGPRLTILKAMPYDRERTVMDAFPMCPRCREEYTSPENRRYDAQPVCCNDCGPTVYLLSPDGDRLAEGADAIRRTRRILMDGGVAAVKGIGGFHLCCDARSERAVRHLRERKRRPVKPFAVMMPDLETARKYCAVPPEAEAWLTGWQKPILLLKKNADCGVCGLVAPGNDRLGVMLPYAPLQLLLFGYPDGLDMTDCLVMTSGNASGAPICRSDADAVAEIGSYCDVILSHDREILIRADDTVTDLRGGKPYMIRRSRGWAPLPVMLSESADKTVLAIGGELKNTFCIAGNDLYYLSAYVGDMADVRTQNALRETVGRLQTLLEMKPGVVVCDTHPLYQTVEIAKELGLPVRQVQHHWAHILSCMAENDRLDEVIGVSFDGTGYGGDGTIWGGEIMACTVHGYRRLGHISPFAQPGGDASSREGWRIALSMLDDAFENADAIADRLGLDAKQLGVIRAMKKAGVNCVTSTSCGRLFDAVSAVLGVRRASTFEGEAATALQTAAERAGTGPRLVVRCEDCRIDTADLFGEIVRRRLDGEDAGRLAYAFHDALADGIAAACVQAREKTGLRAAALSGGVFQNTLLVELTREKLEREQFDVLLHSQVPPNDGGLALGQALYGMMND